MKYYPKPCPNNGAVICPDHSKCNKCGWDPDVAKKRLEAVTDELKKRGAKRGDH